MPQAAGVVQRNQVAGEPPLPAPGDRTRVPDHTYKSDAIRSPNGGGSDHGVAGSQHGTGHGSMGSKEYVCVASFGGLIVEEVLCPTTDAREGL